MNIKKVVGYKNSAIELFAGVGGFRLGLEAAGFDIAFASEINTQARETYEKNFGEVPAGDIYEQNLSEIPDHSLLTAGFPCQPFSICGKQLGFKDSRGTLIFKIFEIIKEKSPEVILLENVKQLLHIQKGSVIKTILKELEDLGYKTSLRVMNASDFGVPQNRERVIIIASRNKKFDFDKVKKVKSKKLKYFLCKNPSNKCDASFEYTLIPNPTKSELGLIFAGYKNANPRKTGVKPNTLHLSRTHKQPNRIYDANGYHPTLAAQETCGRYWIKHNERIRKLTINECYRLMGFPRDFKKSENLCASYKHIGNSVCVPMVTEIAREIKLQLL